MPTDIHPLPEDITAYVRCAACVEMELTCAVCVPVHTGASYPVDEPPTAPPDGTDKGPAHSVSERKKRTRCEARVSRSLVCTLQFTVLTLIARRKDRLNRMAPGYDPNSFLVPQSLKPTSASLAPSSPPQTQSKSLNPMDDLVEQLAALEKGL